MTQQKLQEIKERSEKLGWETELIEKEEPYFIIHWQKNVAEIFSPEALLEEINFVERENAHELIYAERGNR